MKKTLLLFAVITLLGCEAGSKNEGRDLNYEIAIEQNETFYLGQAKSINYSFPKDKPNSIKLKNIPSGWSASIDELNNKIDVVCGINVGLSGTYNIDIVAYGNDESIETTHSLSIIADASFFKPVFIGEAQEGVIIVEKTNSSTGLIVYKKYSDLDSMGNQITSWAGSIHPVGTWRSLTLDDCYKIDGALNGKGGSARESFKSVLSSIGGDDLTWDRLQYWTTTEKSIGENYVYSLYYCFDDSGIYSYRHSSVLPTIAVMSF